MGSLGSGYKYGIYVSAWPCLAQALGHRGFELGVFAARVKGKLLNCFAVVLRCRDKLGAAPGKALVPPTRSALSLLVGACIPFDLSEAKVTTRWGSLTPSECGYRSITSDPSEAKV